MALILAILLGLAGTVGATCQFTSLNCPEYFDGLTVTVQPPNWNFYARYNASSVWSVQNWSAFGHHVLQTTGSDWDAAVYTGQSFSTSSLFVYTAVINTSGGRGSLIWDLQASTLDGGTSVGCYGIQYCKSCSEVKIFKGWAGGVGQVTNLVTISSYTLPTTFTAMAVQNGSAISAYVNGTLVTSTADASYTSGYIGFQGYGASTGGPEMFTQFEVDNSTPTPTPTISPTFSPTFTPSSIYSPSASPTRTITPCPQNAAAIDTYFCAQCGPTMSSLGPNGPALTVGSLSFITSPAPPNSGMYALSGWSSANYVSFTAAQNVAFSNLASGGVEFQWNPGASLPSFSIPFMWTDSYLGGFVGIQVSATNGVQFFFNNGASIQLAAASKLNLNAYNNIAFEWGNGNIYGFVNGELTYTGYGLGFRTGTVTNMAFGVDVRSGASNPISGYATQIHFLSGAVQPPILDVCSQTPLPTLTPAITYGNTPTPWATINPTCVTTPNAHWTVVPSPVITPNYATGYCNAAEPFLMEYPNDAGGNIYHMTWSEEDQACTTTTSTNVIALATAKVLSPTAGGTFSYYGALVGKGLLGVNATVAMSTQTRITITAHMACQPTDDRLYWSNRNDGKLYKADSSDGGYHYITSTVAVAIDTALWRHSTWITSSVTQVNATAIVQDPSDASTWWAICELSDTSAFGPNAQYELWLLKSTNGPDNWALASDRPLTTARCVAGNIWAHPRSLTYVAETKTWHMWEGVGLEGPAWHLQSKNLYEWLCDPTFFLSVGGTPQSQWPPLAGSWNQLGDTGHGAMFEGKYYMPFCEETQDGHQGIVGLVSYPGTLKDMEQCTIPSYTPTPLPTATPTQVVVPAPASGATLPGWRWCPWIHAR